MIRRAEGRLGDVLTAIDAIHSHMARGDLSVGMVFDAVRLRLMEIGEAIKSIPNERLAVEPLVPWQDIAAMRDKLAHRYFDTDHGVVTSTVHDDLPVLRAAVERLLG